MDQDAKLKAKVDFWRFVFISMAAMGRYGWFEQLEEGQKDDQSLLTMVIAGGVDSGVLLGEGFSWSVVVEEANEWGLDADLIRLGITQANAEDLAANRRALGME